MKFMLFNARRRLRRLTRIARYVGRSIVTRGEHLGALKSPLVLCLFFSLAVIWPDQTHELYRYIALSFADSGYHRFSIGSAALESAGLFLFCLLVCMSLFTLGTVAQYLSFQATGKTNISRTDRLALALLASVPMIAVAIGIYVSQVETGSAELAKSIQAGAIVSMQRDGLTGEALPALANFEVASQFRIDEWLRSGAAAFLGLWIVFVWFISRRFARLQIDRARENVLILSGLALPIVLVFLFYLGPVPIARYSTTFGVMCLFFVSLAALVTALKLLEDRTRVPFLFAALIFFVCFGLLNDNHRIREVSGKRTPMAAASVGDGFERWLRARASFQEYKAYPVYVVAAEGGGIYAAFRTAAFLASIQDLCPRFSEHLFAISSVSGGSVGAAVFSGLTRKIKLAGPETALTERCQKRTPSTTSFTYSDLSEEILSDDFLSPVLSAFLFQDFLQRFLPFPVPAFDRANALERSLESSWDAKAKDSYDHFPEMWIDRSNPLRELFLDSWNPSANTPALFFNTTEMECGRGVAISPFMLNTPELSSFPIGADFSTKDDRTRTGTNVSLSTAAALSARFPWLTPPGWYYGPFHTPCRDSKDPSPAKINLVDGGYFDNSGALTALAAIDEMDRVIRKNSEFHNVQIHLIILTSSGFTEHGNLLNDYLAPVQTLLSTRTARGPIAVQQAKLRFKQRGYENHSVRTLELQGFGFPLPLGWRLSPITRLMILGQDGVSTTCAGVSSGDCLRHDIVDELANDQTSKN
jgi:hypothetical protein